MMPWMKEDIIHCGGRNCAKKPFPNSKIFANLRDWENGREIGPAGSSAAGKYYHGHLWVMNLAEENDLDSDDDVDDSQCQFERQRIHDLEWSSKGLKAARGELRQMWPFSMAESDTWPKPFNGPRISLVYFTRQQKTSALGKRAWFSLSQITGSDNSWFDRLNAGLSNWWTEDMDGPYYNIFICTPYLHTCPMPHATCPCRIGIRIGDECGWYTMKIHKYDKLIDWWFDEWCVWGSRAFVG